MDLLYIQRKMKRQIIGNYYHKMRCIYLNFFSFNTFLLRSVSIYLKKTRY